MRVMTARPWCRHRVSGRPDATGSAHDHHAQEASDPMSHLPSTEASTATDLSARLAELARTPAGPGPVISVYLDTRWTDEHQRERVRVFLKNEIRKAAGMSAGQLEAQLAWIGAEGEAIVSQEAHPGAAGVAMFAGGAGLREVFPVAVPFRDTFAVADTPRLRPLVTALADAPRAAVLFVDGESARLVAVTEQGAGEEIALETTDVVGQHRRGGWLLLLQSRYQRHIHEHRARHFEAVARALADLVGLSGLRAIVLAGESRNLAVFRGHLSTRLAALIAGDVAGSRHEPSSVLVQRAVELIRHRVAGDTAATLDALLAEAAGGGRAAAGVEAAVDAVNRGTVQRLHLLQSYDETGRACAACHALQRGASPGCRWCGKATMSVDLAEAMVRRVLATGGEVESVTAHDGLGRAGGVAALLRYPAR
jgi:peptide subunit release factor 1 (eRF1)